MQFNINDALLHSRKQLTTIWTALGVEPAAQENTLADLEATACQVFTEAIAHHQSVLDAVEADLQKLTAAHATACARLKVVTEPAYAAYFGCGWSALSLLEQQCWLKEALQRLEELSARRERQLGALHARLYRLHTVLGIPLCRSHALRSCADFKDTGPDLSPEREGEYRQEIAHLNDAKKQADEEAMERLWQEIRPLWAKLQISHAETTRVTAQVAQLRATTTDPDRDEELREQALEALQAHLEQLRGEQQRRLDELVKETSDMLRCLWQEYEAKTGERLSMELPTEGSDSSVAVIEGLVLAMEERLRQMEDIRRVCERRQALLGDEAEMQRAQRDPERLLNKKQNMAQLLLREEKTRNALKRELPKLESRLRQFCLEWEEQHGTPFMLDGQVLILMLEGKPTHPTPPKKEENKGGARAKPPGRSRSQGDILAPAARTSKGDRCSGGDRTSSPMSRAKSHDSPAAIPSPKRPPKKEHAADSDTVPARSASGGAVSPQCPPRRAGPERGRPPSTGRVRTSSLRR